MIDGWSKLAELAKLLTISPKLTKYELYRPKTDKKDPNVSNDQKWPKLEKYVLYSLKGARKPLSCKICLSTLLKISHFLTDILLAKYKRLYLLMLPQTNSFSVDVQIENRNILCNKY